jgi:hypothetical protein
MLGIDTAMLIEHLIYLAHPLPTPIKATNVNK